MPNITKQLQLITDAVNAGIDEDGLDDYMLGRRLEDALALRERAYKHKRGGMCDSLM